MLRNSVARRTNGDEDSYGQTIHKTEYKVPAAARRPTPVLLFQELVYCMRQGLPFPNKPLNTQTEECLEKILDALDKSLALDDQATDLIIVSNSLSNPLPTPTMAGRFPVLSTSDLPRASAEEQSATASPARGTAMLNSIFKSVRVPEFRFKWQFWAEKGQAQSGPASKAGTTTAGAAEDFASRPKPLGEQIISVKEFYQHFNNIPVENLKLRDSIHLFHLGVKPVWEDPRNAKGGAWYFKVGKDIAGQFWHEMCLLAVGDVLQGAVETKRAGKFLLFPPNCFSFSRVCVVVEATANRWGCSIQRRHLWHLVQCALERGADCRVDTRRRQ